MWVEFAGIYSRGVSRELEPELLGLKAHAPPVFVGTDDAVNVPSKGKDGVAVDVLFNRDNVAVSVPFKAEDDVTVDVLLRVTNDVAFAEETDVGAPRVDEVRVADPARRVDVPLAAGIELAARTELEPRTELDARIDLDVTREVDDSVAGGEDTGAEELRKLERLVVTGVGELRTTDPLLAAILLTDESGRADVLAIVVCTAFEVTGGTVTGLVVLPTVTGGALPAPPPLPALEGENVRPSRIGASMGAATMPCRFNRKKHRTRRRAKKWP